MSENDITQTVLEGMAPEMAEPAKKKRVTVAELQKEIEELQTNVLSEMAPWCGELDARLDKIEDANAQTPIIETPMLEARLEAIEKSMPILSDNQAVLLKQHLEHEERLNQQHDADLELQYQIENLTKIPEPTELEFAKPPSPHARSTPTAGDIESVACVCQTMADVLMICRALKDAVGISDQDKIHILNLACKAAGIDDALGLRIRAGVYPQ